MACGTGAGLAGHDLAGQGPDPVDLDPWADRRAGLRETLSKASRYQKLLESGVVLNRAALARREGVSRARVTQVLALLKIDPELRAELEDEDAFGPVPPEKELRKLASIPRVNQNGVWLKLLEAERFKGTATGRGKSSRSRVQRRGLQHQFERARRYQAALEAGEFSSLEELGRNEGLTGGRVAQLLNLLHLAPEIIAVVDVPAAECPAGVSEKKLRAIARLQDQDAQVWAYAELRRAFT